MVIAMPRGSIVLLPDADGVRYTVVRTVAETVRGGVLPVGVVAFGVAPRVSDVAALVEVLFGQRWAVN